MNPKTYDTLLSDEGEAKLMQNIEKIETITQPLVSPLVVRGSIFHQSNYSENIQKNIQKIIKKYSENFQKISKKQYLDNNNNSASVLTFISITENLAGK